MQNKNSRIDELKNLLIEAKDAYYNSDSPIMSDSEFDALEDELRNLDPQNDYFSLVGVGGEIGAEGEISSGAKITHQTPMLSMQKAKIPEEVIKWYSKIAPEDKMSLCIQPKIDGISATCKYSEGKLVYVATRGDGTTGQNITHIANYCNDIPEKISFAANDVEIRGELYLPKNTTFDTGGRPLRNNCAGLINRKENREDLSHIRFGCYQLSGFNDGAKNSLTENEVFLESEKINLLKNNGFNAVVFFVIEDVFEVEKYYNLYLKDFRSEWEYETDGLIITVDDSRLFSKIDSNWVVDHHHHYAIALKPPAEAKQTKLSNIEWQVSRQGNVVPVAIFEPVFIAGAKIERATLNNYDNVVKMDLKKGDDLLIERANDVIPFVRENLSKTARDLVADKDNKNKSFSKKKKIDDQTVDMFASIENSTNDENDLYHTNCLLIEKCPSCESTLEKIGVHMRCMNPDCDEVSIQQIVYWVKESGMETIAEATVRTLYNNKKIFDAADLYSLSESDFEGLEGFAEKKTAKIISEIQNSRKTSAVDFISRLGIPLVQKKSLRKLGIDSIRVFKSFKDDTYVIGQNIIEWKNNPQNMRFFEKLIAVLEIAESDTALNPDKKIVCMTGSGPKDRKSLIAEIEAMGHEFSSNISKDVDILLTNDPAGSSSKLVKARKLGISIISYEEFF